VSVGADGCLFAWRLPAALAASMAEAAAAVAASREASRAAGGGGGGASSSGGSACRVLGGGGDDADDAVRSSDVGWSHGSAAATPAGRGRQLLASSTPAKRPGCSDAAPRAAAPTPPWSMSKSKAPAGGSSSSQRRPPALAIAKRRTPPAAAAEARQQAQDQDPDEGPLARPRAWADARGQHRKLYDDAGRVVASFVVG
jgi:hypothetical protein